MHNFLTPLWNEGKQQRIFNSKVIRPEGKRTMHNFLTPLWNEGKQQHIFNSKVSPQLQVNSDNQIFLRKKTFARQKPAL